MKSSRPDCVRCGYCCMKAPCFPDKNGICTYLEVGNEKTTCLKRWEVSEFGLGCGAGTTLTYRENFIASIED